MSTIAMPALPAPRSQAPRSWVANAARDALYLVSGLPVGIAAFTIAVTALALSAGLLVTLAGIPILVAALYAGRAFAWLERERAGLVLGPPPPAAPDRRWDGSLTDRVKKAVSDPAGWRGVLWALLSLPAGIAGFVVAVTSWSTALGLLTSGAWMWALPEETDEGFWLTLLNDPDVEYALLRGAIGLVLIPVAYLLCRGLARGLALTARGIAG